MSLKTIIQNKDKHFQKLLNSFEKEFNSFSLSAQKELITLFRNRTYDAETLSSLITNNGFDDIVEVWASKYKDVIAFTKEMAAELDHAFIITKETVKNFELLQDMNVKELLDTKEAYVNEIRKFGLQSELDGRTLREITDGLQEQFARMGRRLNTEAITGITMADSAIKKDFFTQAGITKFVYDGPGDGKTRDSCAATLADPRQATGWTMAEIKASHTPFIQRGGWNCRHEWLPFVGVE